MSGNPPAVSERAADETSGGEVEAFQPWHRLPDETDLAYEAFRQYLMMGRGRRSVRLVAEERGVTRDHLGNWSARHQWVARVQAFDRRLDELEELEYTDQRERIARDAATVAGQSLTTAAKALAVGTKVLDQFVETGQRVTVVDGEEIVERVSLDDALKAVRTAAAVVAGARQVVQATKVEVSGPGGGPVQVDTIGVGLSMRDLATAFLRLSGDLSDVGTITPATLELDPSAVHDRG